MTTTERIEEAARKRYTHRYRIEGFIEGAQFGLKLQDEKLKVMCEALQIIHEKSYEDKFYDGPEFRNLIASIFRTANSALDKVKEMDE